MKKIIALFCSFACVFAVAGCDHPATNLPNSDTAQSSTVESVQAVSNDGSNSQPDGSNTTDTNTFHSNIPAQSAEEAYDKFLEDLAQDDPEVYYTIKDIDGNGVKDLVLIDNGVLSVYIFNNAVQLVGKHDFATGTSQFYFSQKAEYPGVFYSFSGGGVDHYGYMTIQGGELLFSELWTYDRSPFADPENPVTEVSSDKEMIDESKFLEKNKCGIKFDLYEK